MLSRLKKGSLVSLGIFFALSALMILLQREKLFEDKISDTASTTTATYGLRIRIPAIGMSALIKDVGLTKEGALEAPENPSEVGLFTGGVRPGEKGTAVIDGHFGWFKNKPAAFDHLASVQVGDKIYINEGDSEIVFIVRSTHVYGKNDVVSEAFYSDDGKARLNLITCSGAWEAAEKSYLDRLVVFSERESF